MRGLLKVSAYVAAMTAIAAPAWAIAAYLHVTPVLTRDIEQIQLQIEQLSKSELALEFGQLIQKRGYGGLTPDEQRRLCQLGMALNYALATVPGCQ